MGSVLVLRWMWERINLWSEVAAIAASLVVTPMLLLWVEPEWLKLLLMAAASTGTMLVVTWLTPPVEEGVLERFYDRVRPPGLWRRTARRAGDDPARPGRAFRRAAYLVVTTAATVYLLLVGATKLVLPRPGEGAWVAWAFVAAAAASVPLWWRGVWSRR